jgi:hypothetical protein
MKRDAITESRKRGEIPTTLVDVCNMGSYVDVSLATVCGLSSEYERVARFADMAAAVAFVESEYGLSGPADDGASAWDGWWLS